VRRWVAVEVVDADELVVGPRCQVAAVRREPDGVYGAEMVTHVTELARLGVALFFGIVYRLGRPDPDVAIYDAGEHT
jgi:hypothetical protein